MMDTVGEVVHDSAMRSSSQSDCIEPEIAFAGLHGGRRDRRNMPSEAVYWKNKYNIQAPSPPRAPAVGFEI